MEIKFLPLSLMFVLAITMMGCATSGDLARVQQQEEVIGARADKALQDAQAAKAAANAAALKADTAASRAENAVKMAEEREKMAVERERKADERIADERAASAEAAYQRSMKK